MYIILIILAYIFYLFFYYYGFAYGMLYVFIILAVLISLFVLIIFILSAGLTEGMKAKQINTLLHNLYGDPPYTYEQEKHATQIIEDDIKSGKLS